MSTQKELPSFFLCLASMKFFYCFVSILWVADCDIGLPEMF